MDEEKKERREKYAKRTEEQKAQDAATRRRHYEKHRERIKAESKAYRESRGTLLDQTIAKGPEAVAALREKQRLQSKIWRNRHGKNKGHPRGAGAKKLIVTIKARPVPDEVRQRYAELGYLIEHCGPAAIRRLRRSKDARRDFAVWSAARDSLPARPIPVEFEAWLAALSRGEHGGAPLSDSSLKNVFFRVSALYRTARIMGMDIRNPFAELEEPRSRDFPAAYSWRVIIEGFPLLLAQTFDWRERAFFTVLRFTGLRVNEVLGLRREHVILSAGGRVELQIASQRRRVSAASETADISDAPLKHEQQRRILPLLNPELIAALLRARRETPSPVLTRDEHRRFVTTQSPYLFPFAHGRMQSLDARLHLVMPNLPRGVGWHAFRHAFSAEARLVARISIDELSQWLGHSSPEVTRGYLRTLLGEQPDLADVSARMSAAQLQRPIEAPAPANVFELPDRKR